MDRSLKISVVLQKLGDLVKPLQQIGGAAKVTRGEFQATKKELDALKAAQRDLSSFRELHAQLRGTSAELNKAQDRVKALAAQVNAAGTPTKKLAAEFANAKKYAAALSEQQDRQAQGLQRLRDRLSSAGVSTRDLVAGERSLRTEIERTTTTLDKQKAALDRQAAASRRQGALKDQLGRSEQLASGMAVGGASAVATGVAVLAPLQQSLDAASSFESTMTSLAQKTGMARAEATRFGQRIAAMAPAVNQLPSALAEGADTLAGLGLDVKGIPQLLQPIGRAATAYQAEIADLSKASFAVVDNLKVPFDQASRSIDIMAEAGKRGAFEMKDMAQYFPSLTAAAQGLGQKGVGSVADLAAALQITRKGAGDSATAANNLQNLLAKINAPGTIDKFKKLGVDLPKALDRAYRKGKTPIEAIAELTNNTLGGDLERMGELFEDMQVQQALRPLIANMGLYRQIREDALKANGTVERDYAERMRDAAEATRRQTAATEALRIRVGNLLGPSVTALRDGISSLLEKLTAWIDANPGVARGLAIAAGAIGLLLVLVGGLAIAAAGILGPFAMLRFAMLTMAPAAWAGAAALWAMVAPLWPFILAGLAVAAAAVTIYRNWDMLMGLGARFASNFMAGLQVIGGFITGLVARFKAMGGDIIRGVLMGMLGPLPMLLAGVTKVGGMIADRFRQRLGIRSPSRVFAEYGGHLMAGLSNGIAGGAGGPLGRMSQVSRDLTAALAVGASVASPAAAGGGAAAPGMAGAATSVVQQVTISIVGAPGQSAADIAQAVARELDKRAGQAAAARRAGFGDYGE